MVKLLTDSRLPEEEHEFFHILNLFFPSIYDVKYLMKSCKNLKVHNIFLNIDNNNKKINLYFALSLFLEIKLFFICCYLGILQCLLGANIVLEKMYIELIGTGICVVNGFNLGLLPFLS